jgi:hypothetical protein
VKGLLLLLPGENIDGLTIIPRLTRRNRPLPSGLGHLSRSLGTEGGRARLSQRWHDTESCAPTWLSA